MYGNIESLENGGGYIKPGIHTVSIAGIKYKQIDTEKFKGEAAEVTFKKSSGETLNETFFAFKYEEGAKDYNGNVLDMAAQWKRWQDSHVATFKQATSDYDAMLKALGEAGDFPSWVKALDSCIKTNGGKEFEVRIIGNKRGYAQYRFRFDSAAEAGSGSLKWNPEQHDQRPAKDESKVEAVADTGESDELPF